MSDWDGETGDEVGPPEVAPDAPRERQRIEVPDSEFEEFRGWIVEGTALAVGTRVRDPEGRIALVQNGWSDGWILPGGGVEPGETPPEAARREVREETSLEARIGDPLVVLEQTYATPEGDRSLPAAYVVYAGTAGGEIPDASELGETDDEIQAAGWFDEVPADFHDGDLLRPYL